ncbi:MAG: hypothetical protein QME94_05035 [Anaerolineae bacterium]|nr:hypothetical protein [Anaerolineae bacterium]
MKNRSAFYIGLLFILAGSYFLLVNLIDALLGLGWAQLWPGVLALAALAFYLPVLVWWGQRRTLSGMVVPGTILLVNALIFFYNALTGDWNAWAYLWSLEPVALALGLLFLWVIGPRQEGLLVAAAALGGVGLLCFAIFGTIFGHGIARLVAPIVLIGLGLIFLIRSIARIKR